jgi:hypothetical protein
LGGTTASALQNPSATVTLPAWTMPGSAWPMVPMMVQPLPVLTPPPLATRYQFIVAFCALADAAARTSQKAAPASSQFSLRTVRLAPRFPAL